MIFREFNLNEQAIGFKDAERQRLLLAGLPVGQHHQRRCRGRVSARGQYMFTMLSSQEVDQMYAQLPYPEDNR